MSSNLLANKINAWVKTAFYLNNKELSIFRILYCSLTIFIIGIPNYSWLGNHPAIIFNPPKYSIAALFHDFPSAFFFELLSLALVICFILLLFGLYTKTVSLLLSFLMLFGQSFMFSFGKIDHNILFVLLPMLLAFSGWGNYYSIDNIRKKHLPSGTWLITIVALTVGFAMFTAGVPKYLHGWLDVSTQATQGYFIKKYYSIAEPALIAPLLIKIKSAVFWESLDYLAVIFELFFLVAVFKPGVFRFFIFLALWFHFINGVMINVFFVSNYLVYLLFLPRSFYRSLQRFLDNGSWSNQFNYINLFIALILGLVFYFCIVFNFPFGDLIMLPSILKALFMIFTEKVELFTSLLLALTGIGIGTYCCVSYLREKIFHF